MKPLYVIDIDGTLADNNHRVHLIRNGNSDWDTFFDPELVFKDTPIPSSLKHFEDGRFIHGDHIFLTARIQSTYMVTMAWLFEHGYATSGWDFRLICKPDYMRLQRSRVFKPSVLSTLKKYDYPDRELILIEDYGEVRRSVEEAGFKVLHAPDCWEEETWTTF